MKQLFTYISPDKKFNAEHQMAVKIQIDNSLRLGWKREDILLVTNFYYEHNGVKSIVIGDENYCDYFFFTTKIYVIVELFNLGMIEENEMYWYHDFDCFQLNEITEGELELERHDMGLSNYGRRERLCSASMFFKKGAEDIFRSLKEDTDRTKVNEEICIMRLINRNKDTLGKRVKLLNTTYAFQKWNIKTCYPTTNKPIKAVHFHLTPDKYDFFVLGNNKLNLVIIPEELIKIFNKYGFNKNEE